MTPSAMSPSTKSPARGAASEAEGRAPSDKARRRTSIRQDAVNLPNLLTMARIALIPVVLWLLADGTPEMSFWAAMVYAVSAITDFVDGYLARRMNLISVLGKFLDPLADKLMVMATLVMLVGMGRVHYAIVAVILARELSITSLRVIAMSEGVTIAAGQGGKEKAALQMVAIFMLIIRHTYDVDFGLFAVRTSFHDVGLTLLWVSVAWAIVSAGEYVKLFVEAVEQKEKRLAEQDREA